ncbi:MAG: RNA polymerase sigma factor [Prevotella sp.]|nr:RNA polymerase sigma factor [Candidatus Equicola faecalis]
MLEKDFEKIVRQYGERLYWQIRRMVYSHDDADDILQNTFLKAWMNIDSFRGNAKISTWLYRIAVNEALDFIRKNKNAVELSDGDVESSVAVRLSGDAYFDGDEAQLLLQEAIGKLPPKQRLVFNMRYFDEMKYSEISRILDTSEGALKASYHLAVEKISEYLKVCSINSKMT